MFRDRAHAARLLAEALDDQRDAHPVVLAIPRGAVPMGRLLADALDGTLDVVLVHKIGAPGNPELAIGSVDEQGHAYLEPYASGYAPPSWITDETQRQVQALARRRERYGLPAPGDLAGKVAIVIDDGVATGSTMISALRATRARNPARLIAAVPVAPPGAITRLRTEADEVVCLEAPSGLVAVSQYYRSFPQVDDAEVRDLLRPAATA